jgi:uncharacterized membrane protein YccC
MSAVASTLPAGRVASVAGLALAIRIVIGAGIVWLIVRTIGHRDPLWALISVVIVSDVQLDATVIAFRGRAANTLVGCAIGLAFLYLLGPASWSILLAMSAAVLASTYSVQTLTAWRIAPVTVVLVMTPSFIHGSVHAGTAVAITRVVEVLIGSAVAVLVASIFALIARARRYASAQARS